MILSENPKTIPDRVRDMLFPDHASRPEVLEDHLVSPKFGARPLRVRADRPGKQRTAEQVACNPRTWRGQIVDVVGDEMRPGTRGVQQKRQRPLLLFGQLAPFRIDIVAL